MYFPLFVGALCLSLFCYALLCLHSSFAISFKRKRNIVVLLLLSYYYVLWLFLTVPWVGLQCLIVVFPDHTGFVFYMQYTDGGQNYSSLSFFLYVLTSEAQWVTCLATDACLTADPGA